MIRSSLSGRGSSKTAAPAGAAMRRKKLPVYILCGFLDSGKTTFINHLLRDCDLQNTQILVLQFESGEEELEFSPERGGSLCFDREDLQQSPSQLAGRISERLGEQSFDEIWVEWNGLVPFSRLQEIALTPALRRLCDVEQVLYLADGESLELQLTQTGGAVPEQIAACDLAAVRNADTPKKLRRAKALLRSISPGLAVFPLEDDRHVVNRFFSKRSFPVLFFCWGIALLAAAYQVIVKPFFHLSGTPLNTVAVLFLGILLQALPFLLIGVLISSAIQTFLPADAIRRRFPKNPALGILTAVALGFCLPVCDCAAVPIFRTLVRKGVPLPAAITFLTVTPVINPVVLLSTYYAFSGNLRAVGVRAGLGILSAVLIGLSFFLHPGKVSPLTSTLDSTLCSCGYSGGTAGSRSERWAQFFRHSQSDFFSIGKYLLWGALCSSLFQALGIGSRLSGGKFGYLSALLFLMMLAFFLSLCSSSDAIVVSVGLPTGAAMGFLVFGPMMDLKNLLMLSGGFSRKFVIRLVCSTFGICFLVVFLLARPLLGG